MKNRSLALSALASAFVFSLLPAPSVAQRFVAGEEEEFPIVQYPDSLYSLNDRCIVRLRKLSLRMPAAYVNGLPIGFCWTPCYGVFGKDPETYLNNRDIELKGYFNKESAALVEKEKRAQVNYEFFYFADEAGKEQFESDPLRWCGTVTDPISRERFRPTEKSAVAEHNGIPFFFSSEDTKTAFAAHPDSFSVMHQKMFEMDAD